MSNPNLELWNLVCETDPSMTKKVNIRGGFTSVCAQYQLKNATAIFGRIGTGFGLKNVTHSFSPKGSGIIYAATFWYKYHDEVGEWEVRTDMPYDPKDDTLKKCETDCLTKALSRLGFNSDVFENKFADNKYVAEMKRKFGGGGDPIPPISDATEQREKAFRALALRGIKVIGERPFQERYETLMMANYNVPSWKSIEGDEGKVDCYRDMKTMVEAIEAVDINMEPTETEE